MIYFVIGFPPTYGDKLSMILFSGLQTIMVMMMMIIIIIIIDDGFLKVCYQFLCWRLGEAILGSQQ